MCVRMKLETLSGRHTRGLLAHRNHQLKTVDMIGFARTITGISDTIKPFSCTLFPLDVVFLITVSGRWGLLRAMMATLMRHSGCWVTCNARLQQHHLLLLLCERWHEACKWVLTKMGSICVSET